MNWDAAGAIGEIVGAAAVIGSLVYFALQIRESRKQARVDNFHSAISNLNTLNAAMGSDPELVDLVTRGVHEYGLLKDKERIQYSYFQMAYFNCFWLVFHQFKAGAISREEWLPFAQQVAHLLTQPGPIACRQNDALHEEMFKSVEAMALGTDNLNLTMTRTDSGST